MACRSSTGAFSAFVHCCHRYVSLFFSVLEQTELQGRVRRRGSAHTIVMFNYRKYDSVPLCCCGIMFLLLVCQLIAWTIFGRFVLCRVGSAGGLAPQSTT